MSSETIRQVANKTPGTSITQPTAPTTAVPTHSFPAMRDYYSGILGALSLGFTSKLIFGKFNKEDHFSPVLPIPPRVSLPTLIFSVASIFPQCQSPLHLQILRSFCRQSRSKLVLGCCSLNITCHTTAQPTCSTHHLPITTITIRMFQVIQLRVSILCLAGYTPPPLTSRLCEILSHSTSHSELPPSASCQTGISVHFI